MAPKPKQFPANATLRGRRHKSNQYKKPIENHLDLVYIGDKRRKNYYLDPTVAKMFDAIQEHVSIFDYEMVHVTYTVTFILAHLKLLHFDAPNSKIAALTTKAAKLDDLSDKLQKQLQDLPEFAKFNESELIRACIAITYDFIQNNGLVLIYGFEYLLGEHDLRPVVTVKENKILKIRFVSVWKIK